MSKLHELLAVEPNLTGQSVKTRTDLMGTFNNKKHLFQEKIVTFQPIEEGSKPVTEEQTSIQAQVRDEVKWISDILAKAIDAGYQIDVGNTLAKADIVTEDGDTIANDVPATSLLQLEKRLQEVRLLVESLPTLDPAKGFTPDPNRPKGQYISRVVNKNRTKKVEDYQVVVQPTKEHPAQIVKVTKDVVTGTISEQEWTSMISPAHKADVMAKIDVLTRAVKKARARANEQEVDVTKTKVGKKILDYIFKPLA